MSAWTLHVPELVVEAVADTLGLYLELDPRRQQLSLGVRVIASGSTDLWNRAIYRRFFEGERADWRAVLDWLEQPAAQALLATISEGYQAELMWTGDWLGDWSESAWGAAEELHQQLASRLAAGAVSALDRDLVERVPS